MYGYSSSNYSTGRTQEVRPKEKDQPLDTVSSIVWDTNNSNSGFIVSSWDGWVRYYLVKSGQGSSTSL
jgi:hypothetical protein